MAELKTKPTDADVNAFIASIPDAQKRADSLALLKLMEKVTGQPPKMWGDAMVGFGTYRYRYASGREGEWFPVGFSPRKTNLTVYLGCSLDAFETQLDKLGKHTRGKGCLYLKRLADADLKVLEAMVKDAYNNPPSAC